MHKITCVSAAVPRHGVEGFTLAAIQHKIDDARPGDVLEIPKGRYADDGVALSISKPLHIVGEGTADVVIGSDLTATDAAKTGGQLIVANLKIEGIVDVEETVYDQITFLSVEVECPKHLGERGRDAFTVGKCEGKFLLFGCKIIGGYDGLKLSSWVTDAHIKETDIQYAQNRGILANPSFTIEDSAVYGCGGYGIKGRAGWEEKGNNEIQPGPWSPLGPSAAGKGGSGMFGGYS